MFALLMGIACATYAQGVTNDSTATAKEDGLELVKDVYPQTEEDGDLYHGLTKKLMFDRMIPPHGLEVTYDKTVIDIRIGAVRYVDLGSPNLIAGQGGRRGERYPREGDGQGLPQRDEHERHHGGWQLLYL